MELKFKKVLNALCRRKFLTGLIFFLVLSSCSKERGYWEGVWNTKLEYIAGLPSDFEFDLRKKRFTGKWKGRWEAKELLDSGELTKVDIADDSLKLDFGDGQIFKGKLSQDNRVLKGMIYGSDRLHDTLKFFKVENWTSERPARVNQDGIAVKHWKYKMPELIDDDWDVTNLKDSRISQQPITELFRNVVDGRYKGLDAVLIAHDGQLVLEEYFHLGAQNRIHTIQSCTKSVTSLLVGIAHDTGLIADLKRPIQRFFPNYVDPPDTNTWHVSLENALTMSAGLDWNEWDVPISDPKNDVLRMLFSQDMYDFVLKRKMADGAQPGEMFEYNSGLSVLLGGVLLDATGMPADTFAGETLFSQLGIKNYNWLSVHNQVHTGGGLWLQPRDFLKIGQLVLDNGKWKGKRVLSESWIKKSTAFHLPARGNSGYGYQWWRGDLSVNETKFPVIWAEGYGGQFLFIVPDLNLVTLFLHHNPKDLELKHTMAWKEMEKFIIPALLTD